MFHDSGVEYFHHRKLGRDIAARFRWLYQKNHKRKRFEWSRVFHYLLKSGNLSVGRDERKTGLWQAERTADGTTHVYMSCYWCGAVNDFSDHQVGSDGFVYPCVVCRECDRHEFVYLDRWTLGERKEVQRDKAQKV